MPALEFQTTDYQNEVKSLLKQKGFKIVEDQDINRANYKGQYLLSFVTKGVFRIQELANPVFIQEKFLEGGRCIPDSKIAKELLVVMNLMPI
jgi:hypothetical protein